MASHRLKETSDGKRFYEISVSRGHGVSPYTMRWYPPEGWSKKAIESKLKTVEGEFEMRCLNGEVLTRKEKRAIEEKRMEAEAKILTVKQYGEKVLLPAKAMECSENTRYFYKNALNTHIYPKFGDKKLSEITTEQLKAFILEKQQSDLSQSSLTAIYITLGQIFKSAYDDEMISRNPMDRVKKPKKNKTDSKDKEVEAFSVAEIQSIMENLTHEPMMWQAFVNLLIDTGMRKGEACGLKWKCVDFKNNTIKIENNLCYTPDKGIYEDTPKTEQSKRIIDVSPEVMALLKKLIPKAKDSKGNAKVVQIDSIPKIANKNGYVFSMDDGITPIHPDAPTKFFSRFGKRYGIEDFHPHKLRHSFASIAITNGADVASVSEKLGHANKGITLKMYTHADQESMRRASDIFRNALKEKQA